MIGRRHKQPDGSVVWCYPGDEEFGTYGFYSYHLDRLLVYLDRWMELE